MLDVGDDVTHRDPKGEGGYGYVNFFQKDLGGTSAYMKIIYIATKGCVQLTSNDTYFTDIWLSSVKTSE